MTMPFTAEEISEDIRQKELAEAPPPVVEVEPPDPPDVSVPTQVSDTFQQIQDLPPGAMEDTPAQIVERDAEGNPTVVEFGGEKFFTPESTSYKQGFRTETERLEAQRLNATQGIHEGELIGDDTIIIVNTKGEPVARFTPEQIAEGKVDIDDYFLAGQVRTPVKGFKGEVKLKNEQVAQINATTTDKGRFDLLKKFGVISPDATFVTDEQIKQAETEAKLAKIEQAEFEKRNTQLPDGQWISIFDLNTMQKEAPEIWELLTTKGFTAANEFIDKINEEAKKNEVAIKRLSFVTDKEGFVDGAKYLLAEPGDFKTLENAGFDDDIIKIWNGQATEEKRFRNLSIVKQIWEILTPHDEASGETYIEYMKRWPDRVVANFTAEPLNQEQLAAQYNAYESLPLWARVLTDTPVIKDEKSGEFRQLIIGYAPAVGGASKTKDVVKTGKKVVNLITRKQTGLTKSQYKRFLEVRVNNPKLTPNQFKIGNKIDSKASTAKWNKFIKEFDAAEKEASIIKARTIFNNISKAKSVKQARLLAEKAEAEQQAEFIRKLTLNFTPTKDTGIGEINKQIRKELARIAVSGVKAEQASTAVIQSTLAGSLTTKLAAQQIQTWQQLSPAKAVQAITKSQSAVAVFATNPSEFAEIVTTMNPVQATEVSQYLETQLQAATQAKVITAPQTKVLVDALVDLQTKILEQVAQETAVKQSQKTATQTQLKNAVENALKRQVETITSPAIRQKVAVQVKTLTKIQQPVKTPAKTVVKAKTTKPPTGRIPDTKPPKIRTPIKVRLNGASGKKKKKKKIPASALIVWPQGFGFWVASPPYTKKDDYEFVRKAPAGAKVFKGIGAAFEGIVALGGDAQVAFDLDLGIIDVKVRRKKGQKPKITFKRDPKQKTKGDVSIGGVR